MPAIGCVAVVKPVSALCQTRRGCSIYDCFAADRRQASSYTDCDHFQALVKTSGLPTAARYGIHAARMQRYGRGLRPVGAGLPAIGCVAVVKPVSALCQAVCGCSVYDCFAADRRQASSYTDSNRFQALVKTSGLLTAARYGIHAARMQRYGRGLRPVGAGLPAIGCAAVVKPVSALCQAVCGCSVCDCCAADRRQASSYRDCDRFQALVKDPGHRQQPGAGRGQRQPRLAVIRRPRPQALAAAEPRVYSRSLRRFSRFSMCNTWPCSIIAPQCPSQKRSPLTQ